MLVDQRFMSKYSRADLAKIDSVSAAAFSHKIRHKQGNKYYEFYEALITKKSLTPDVTFLKTLLRSPLFESVESPNFTFIDLFCGIGGMRLAAEKQGGVCVFSSDSDRFAKLTYMKNFGEIPFGDITKIELADIPEADMLLAGFPCQAFSQAGYRNGFQDTRGTLFFNIEKIIRAKKPKFILLENVKGLVNHDGGKTFAVILEKLRSELGYFVPEPKILNSRNFGVPQNRERIYIVAFRDHSLGRKFCYPTGTPTRRTVDGILEHTVSAKYFLPTSTLRMLENHRKRHHSKGNGFGMQILDPNSVSNSVLVGGMGRERNLIIDFERYKLIPKRDRLHLNPQGIRRLTPREFGRLQGFPEKFAIEVSDSQAYKQFGNSVSIPVVSKVITSILSTKRI